ncbi:MAG: bifunctional hydroxymethylpyrimidine kinase/phosphomethylpyrimidine kinase [Candidatus Cloacimonetes bacterium]|nr:bifunctional hydroxymethylpyrimidine kinase/phosphomethylpyrimidine kinase [Candidatus Cloacimonadota bacterium]MBS3767178.1 bifunctional hydroxymethylpyrimidine kinase/phosphomethylpyrimidine kinase [Candidatus Cloacimonadota bacterium]
MEYEALALTIAGSDSGGGAGIQADLKTFQTFNVFGMSVVTSVTSQNTQDVRSIEDIDAKIVGDQIDMIMEDMGCDAAKTGMVSNEKIIETIAKKVKEHNIKKLVVDPVMVSKSGARLLKKEAEKAMLLKLIPTAYLLTPNIPEAVLITGIPIKNKDDVKIAAEKIYELGAANVLIKGGHFEEDTVTDVLFDGDSFRSFSDKRIDSQNTHGTGCTLSSAITASLAKDLTLYDSIKIAKDFITRSIENAPHIGKGYGPLYHKTIPKDISAFDREAKDFDYWFSKNENVFQAEFLAEKELFPESENSLSIGVGSGLFAAKLGIKNGVEPSKEMAKLAEKRGINVEIGTAEQIPFASNKFDVVLLSTVLSYVTDPLKALREAHRVLKKDGHIVVSFLAREGSYTMLYDLARLMGKFDMERAPSYPYPIKFIKGASWVSFEQTDKLMHQVGFTDFEYVQTLTKHPKYTDEDVEKPQKGYKKGDYIVIKARKK